MGEARRFGKFAIGLALVGLVMSSFFGAAGSGGVSQTDDVEILGGTGQLALSSGGSVDNVTAMQSTLGDAVRLTGAPDSKVSATTDANVSGDWSLCTHAAADPAVVSNNESRSIAGFNAATLAYNGTSDEYVGHYWDAGSRNSYAVSVAAPSPEHRTLVCLQESAGTLEITRNTTGSGTVSLSADSTAPMPPAANWDGTVEETRVHNASLNVSQRSDMLAEPVLAVDGPAPAARLKYDVRNRGAASVPIYFGGGTATLSNASFVGGATGPTLAEGVDYEIAGVVNSTVVALDGGVLDENGEVVHARYDASAFGGFLLRLEQAVASALGLLTIGLVVIAAAVLLNAWDEF